jgi:hypothetical protein
MSNISVNVDTQPMASAIDGVSRHVDATTAAVVTLQTAVILAGNNATETICRNVEQGFFAMLRSQLTQKMAALQSTVDSVLMEMRQEAESLQSIRRSMERDYNMISSRYTKLFGALDSALHSRVKELDQGAFELKDKHARKLLIRAGTLQASVPSHQIESVSSTQLFAASQARASALRTIQIMHRFIFESAQQKKLEVRILVKATPARRTPLYLPVLYWEQDSLQMARTQWESRVPSAPEALQSKLSRYTQNFVSDSLPGISATPCSAQERELVAAEFNRLFEQSAVTPRVRRQMAAMFDACPWQAMARAV